MLSKPDGWTPQQNDISQHCSDGRDGVYSAFSELKLNGYAYLMVEKEKGKISKKQFIIYESPCLNPYFTNVGKPNTEKPYTEKPYMEKPYKEKPHISNTNIENTELVNIELVNIDLVIKENTKNSTLDTILKSNMYTEVINQINDYPELKIDLKNELEIAVKYIDKKKRDQTWTNKSGNGEILFLKRQIENRIEELKGKKEQKLKINDVFQNKLHSMEVEKHKDNFFNTVYLKVEPKWMKAGRKCSELTNEIKELVKILPENMKEWGHIQQTSIENLLNKLNPEKVRS